MLTPTLSLNEAMYAKRGCVNVFKFTDPPKPLDKSDFSQKRVVTRVCHVGMHRGQGNAREPL